MVVVASQMPDEATDVVYLGEPYSVAGGAWDEEWGCWWGAMGGWWSWLGGLGDE